MEEITLLQGGVHTFVLNDDKSDAEPDLIDFVLTKGKIFKKYIFYLNCKNRDIMTCLKNRATSR